MTRAFIVLLGICLLWHGVDRAEAKNTRKRSSSEKSNTKKPKKKSNMPPGWNWPVTNEMAAKGKRCLAELTTQGIAWKPAKARKFITTPIVVPSMQFAGLKVIPTFRKGPFVMDCHLALAITKLAPSLLQAKVRALRFSSIHSVRKVRTGGKKKKSLSRHALGLAIDVYEIAPRVGPVLIIKKHYYKRPLAKAVETLANASNQFRMVLSPANDPKSHHDHLHFEASVGDKKRVIQRGKRAKRRRALRRRRKAKRKRRTELRHKRQRRRATSRSSRF